jgi:hypothetical protein
MHKLWLVIVEFDMTAHHTKRSLLVVASARHGPGYGCALRQVCLRPGTAWIVRNFWGVRRSRREQAQALRF